MIVTQTLQSLSYIFIRFFQGIKQVHNLRFPPWRINKLTQRLMHIIIELYYSQNLNVKVIVNLRVAIRFVNTFLRFI